MSTVAIVILLAWLPACIALMALLPPLRAVVWGYLIAMLLLPTTSLHVEVVPDIDKWQMTGLGLTIGALWLRSHGFWSLRTRWPDWCLLAFLTCTGVSSLTNELGFYDGLSTIFRAYLVYGAPYLLLRMFCRTESDVLWVCRAIVIAAACYAVLAVWEWRMSPQLHRMVYGYTFQGWGEHRRYGFFRPLLFFEHGIPLAFFFAGSSVLSLWLWLRGSLRPFRALPSWSLVALPTVGMLVGMTYGAYFAWLVAIVTLMALHLTRKPYLALVPLCLAIGWSGLRYWNLVETQPFVDFVYDSLPERAGSSFEYRVVAETSLLARARDAQWFGWAGWGRNRIGAVDKWGQSVAIDSLWVDTVGKHGLVGLGFFYAWFTGATLVGLRCLPRFGRQVSDIGTAATALTIMVGVEFIDWQFNGFVNPPALFAAAMLVSLSQMVPQVRPAAVLPRLPQVRSNPGWMSRSSY